eukprot:Pgem_evm1s7390
MVKLFKCNNTTVACKSITRRLTCKTSWTTGCSIGNKVEYSSLTANTSISKAKVERKLFSKYWSEYSLEKKINCSSSRSLFGS